MYNVDLRKKRCFLPGKLYEEKKNGFTCFKTYVNYLHRSVLSCNCITSYVAQIQHFRESKISKDQNWSSASGKFVLQKVYLFKHVSEILLPIWSVLLICTTFMLSYFMEFFWDVCFYVFLFVVLMLFCCCFCSFLCCFHFWPKFLLLVKIQPLRCWIKYKSNNCVVGIDIEDSIYSRELSVQQIL